VLLAADGIGGIVAIVAGIVIAAAAPSTGPVLVAAAIWIGKTRLIDNILVK